MVYATELANGFDKIFDAVEYTIRFNMEAQERLTLFNEKVEELKKLFVEESLERLKTLSFVLDKKKKGAQGKSKSTTAKDTMEIIATPVQNANKPEEKTNDNEDSVLLAAKEIMAESKVE